MSVLSREDMISEFIYEGYPAWPHPSGPGWIMMSLHHRDNAYWVADHNGWEPAPMGWKPKAVKRCIMPTARDAKGHTRQRD